MSESNKKMSLAKFFRSHFPIGLCPQYILFENMKTGWFDVVGRSGYILCSIPPMPGIDYQERKALADEVLSALENDSFGLWFTGGEPVKISARLCRCKECYKHDSKLFEYSNCYPVAEYPYHPDDFSPLTEQGLARELQKHH